MSKLLKLDLHTHPIQALKKEMGIQGIRDINKAVALAIVKAVKKAGLNGIAITEHNNFNHGWVAALEIMDHFQHENLVILPGSEIEFAGQHYLQIFIPDYIRCRVPFFQRKEWFLVLAHPGFYTPLEPETAGQIKIDAVESAGLLGDFAPAAGISNGSGIPLVRASNAHRLEDLGRYYIEVETAS